MPKIVRFAKTGGPEVLEIRDEPVQSPKAGEIRLKVEALGLNRAECMFRAGAYLESPALPSRLGYEAAGVIDAVGPGVTDHKVGDRVSTIPAFGLSQYGVYGESAIVPAFAAAPYPESFTSEQGAAIWMQYITAWAGLIERGELARGQAALITAASSSVGLAAIQIARAEGAIAIAATRKPDKKAKLLEAGADHVIVTEDENLPERVRAITGGKGADVILDPVAGPYVETLAEAAAHEARFLIYGLLDPRPTPFPIFAAFQKCFTMRAFTLFEFTTRPPLLEKSKSYVSRGLGAGTLVPVIDNEIFSLDRISDAHRYMESNVQFGKIIVRI
jgi:NADPH:quinone reductase-like Zn-dependent oxidoreductase